MLRTVIGSEVQVQQVSATTSSRADHIPSVDTMASRVLWENGIEGVISLSFACTFVKFELEITGTEGYVLLQRKLDGPPGYNVTVNGQDIEEFGFSGIENEFEAFAKACQEKDPTIDCNTPLEALKDLEIVEACLESGKGGGSIVTVSNNTY